MSKQELVVSPQSKGGSARAAALTPEQRKEQARKAALSRWDEGVPQATHEGDFKIKGVPLAGAVLPNGKRLLTQATFLRSLGRSRSPKGGTGVLTTVDGIPFFLQAEALKPFITEDLMMSTTPIFFRTRSGGRAVGYDAELLPMVAEVYLKYRDERLAAGKPLAAKYASIVKACDILMRGLARVGIVALVDEATGYQYDRGRQALEEILERFISKELVRWVKMFPDDFYEQLFRLRGWKYAVLTKRPILVGKLTNDIVYRRLAPGVLDELRKATPRTSSGRLKNKLFQRLTEDVGHPKLREHLASVITLMRACDDGDYETFVRLLDRSLPKYKKLPLFDKLDGADEEVLDGTTAGSIALPQPS